MADELTLDSANTNPKYGSLACFSDEKRIGKGQFSEVWRAISKVDNSVVALKKVQVSGYVCKVLLLPLYPDLVSVVRAKPLFSFVFDHYLVQ